MTLQGKIFRILFFVLIGFGLGMLTGYSLFDKPQTINEIRMGKVKANENGSIDINVAQDPQVDNSTEKKKSKNKKNRFRR